MKHLLILTFLCVVVTKASPTAVEETHNLESLSDKVLQNLISYSLQNWVTDWIQNFKQYLTGLYTVAFSLWNSYFKPAIEEIFKQFNNGTVDTNTLKEIFYLFVTLFEYDILLFCMTIFGTIALIIEFLKGIISTIFGKL